MQLQTLDHVGLAVSDVRRSIAWYEDVLGLERAYEQAWGTYPAVLVAGGTGVALFATDEPIAHATLDSLPHVAFSTHAAGFAEAREQLRAAGLEFKESDHRISRSLYVRDPDGNLIEITTYQEG